MNFGGVIFKLTIKQQQQQQQQQTSTLDIQNNEQKFGYGN